VSFLCKVGKRCTVGDVSDGSIIRPMRLACWVTKATETHSECVIFLAFPRQESLRERASILRYRYVWSPLYVWTHQSIYNVYGSPCGSQGTLEERGERSRLCTKGHNLLLMSCASSEVRQNNLKSTDILNSSNIRYRYDCYHSKHCSLVLIWIYTVRPDEITLIDTVSMLRTRYFGR